MEDITIKIKYLAALRDKTGKKEEHVDFPQGSTLSNVAEWLHRTYGLSVPNQQIMAVLNGKGWSQYSSGIETRIKEGDSISLFPPISGG
ncbi:MAG: MoaD/ThiS family protein [Spirochaetota bacterium]